MLRPHVKELANQYNNNISVRCSNYNFALLIFKSVEPMNYYSGIYPTLDWHYP